MCRWLGIGFAAPKWCDGQWYVPKMPCDLTFHYRNSIRTGAIDDRPERSV